MEQTGLTGLDGSSAIIRWLQPMRSFLCVQVVIPYDIMNGITMPAKLSRLACPVYLATWWPT